MDLKTITRFRLRRVNPYRGLVIDEKTWAEAHDYHRDHVRLHARLSQRSIVAGGGRTRQRGRKSEVPGVASTRRQPLGRPGAEGRLKGSNP
jgi:hypothetical protein